MPIAHYEEIHKDRIETQLLERYRGEINDVRELGFDSLQFAREVTFPFSLIVIPWAYLTMREKREVFRIEFPLRYVLMNPLLTNPAYDTYCNIFGMGTKFATRFEDGTILISANYPTGRFNRPRQRFYKYAPSYKEDTAIIWQQHLERIEQIEATGTKTDRRLSLDTFEQMMAVEDKALLWQL